MTFCRQSERFAAASFGEIRLRGDAPLFVVRRFPVLL
jgi:hypothetical protein